MNTPPPEWLTSAQAANRLGVAKKTVARWADDGHLHVGRTPGGHRRYTAASVNVLRRRMELGEFTAKKAPDPRLATAARKQQQEVGRPGGQKS